MSTATTGRCATARAVRRAEAGAGGAGRGDRGRPLPELLRCAVHRGVSHAYRCAWIHQAHCVGKSARFGAANSGREHSGRELRAGLPGGRAVRGRVRDGPAEPEADPDCAAAAARDGCVLGVGRDVPAAAPGTRKLRVACIGGGPASLACAAELCRQGAQATVIDRRELPGGLNTYGVAEYKLRAADSVREVEMIRRLGVEFRCGVDVDSAAALEALEAEFDFIFLGLGLGAMQRLNIPGEEADGVMNALELIAAYKTGHMRELHGTVAVVGAGNTAIDAANAARRLGAETVYMLYRRSESEMSAFDFEYEHAKQEGVQFLWRRMPLAIRAG